VGGGGTSGGPGIFCKVIIAAGGHVRWNLANQTAAAIVVVGFLRINVFYISASV